MRASNAGICQADPAAVAALRAKLQIFYAKHNASKLLNGSVEKVASYFAVAGREAELEASLVKEYGVGLASLPTSNSASLSLPAVPNHDRSIDAPKIMRGPADSPTPKQPDKQEKLKAGPEEAASATPRERHDAPAVLGSWYCDATAEPAALTANGGPPGIEGPFGHGSSQPGGIDPLESETPFCALHQGDRADSTPMGSINAERDAAAAAAAAQKAAADAERETLVRALQDAEARISCDQVHADKIEPVVSAVLNSVFDEVELSITTWEHTKAIYEARTLQVRPVVDVIEPVVSSVLSSFFDEVELSITTPEHTKAGGGGCCCEEEG